ncbi:hypothetical protein ACLQ28_15180 [Micromonospora sp. DT201]|uniref:hypothetical protein n=1 Tax=Micromonospora sp. DT201 TaxID=3393442 RepID=UPI003CFB0C6D
MAHKESFEAWYHGRGHGSGSYPEAGIFGIPAGAMYLGILLVLAVLGGILSLGLIRDWGLVYPRWVPILRGRRVPPWFPLTPGVLGSLLLVGYGLTLPVQIPRGIAEASTEDPFTLTGALIGLPILIIWTIALPIVTYSYWRRTRTPRTPARSFAMDGA